MANKKQAVLIELLSQRNRKAESSALAVPNWYRRPGAVPAKRFGEKDGDTSASAVMEARRPAEAEDPGEPSDAESAEPTAENPTDETPQAPSEPAVPPTADTVAAESPALRRRPGSSSSAQMPTLRPAPVASVGEDDLPPPPEDTPAAAEEAVRRGEDFFERSEPPAAAPAAPASAGTLADRVTGWLNRTWTDIRSRLPQRSGAAATSAGAFDDGDEDPFAPRTDAGAIAAGGPTVVAVVGDRLVISLSFPLTAITIFCLVMLCAIFFLLGRGAGIRAAAEARPTEPAAAAARQPAPPAPAPEPVFVGGGVSASPDLSARELAADAPVREEGALYVVFGVVPDNGDTRPPAELLSAQKWLRERHGFETGVERVYKGYWSLAGVEPLADPTGRETVAAQAAVEAFAKEYRRVGGFDLSEAVPRRWPWGG